MSTVPTLTTPVPSRSDPVNFASRADTFLGELPAWGDAINVVAGEVNTNASTASASASTATTQAGIATTKANEAAVSAATAINAPGTTATSTTSNTIGTGSKTFTIQTGKAFVVGQWVTIADTAAPSTNYMVGIITAHNSGTGSITANVSITLGGGTLNSWSIAMTAAGGVTLNSNQTLTNKTISFASNTLTGVMPNVTPGTSGNVLTSNGSAWVSSAPVGGGTGTGAWSDVTASRTLGTTYTNTGTTTRWVSVSVSTNTTAGVTAWVCATGGEGIWQQSVTRNTGSILFMQAIFPVAPGATYQVTDGASTLTKSFWKEYQ